MATLHYATYFDRNYLLRGLALYRSLVRHSPAFTLWVLCLDEATRETLDRLALPGVEPVPLAELERRDPELPEVRGTRRDYEYYWTCGPTYLLDLFERQPEIELLTYLDADLFFFGDPAPVYETLGGGAILMVENRIPPNRPASSKAKGLYNVGLIVFRRDPQTLACLRRWREQCREWCYDRLEPNRFADQKYLEEWPERYAGVVVIGHKGVGLATWNLDNFRFRYAQGRVWVDDDPLVYHHYSRLRTLTPWLYDSGASSFQQRLHPVVRRHVFVPYLRELRAVRRELQRVGRLPARAAGLRPPGSSSGLLAQMLRHRSFVVVTDWFAL